MASRSRIVGKNVVKVQTRPPATSHCFAGLVKMRNVEPILKLSGALKVYRRSPSPSRLTAPRGIANLDEKTRCSCTRWALISQDCGYELTRGLVQQLRAATASLGAANSTKFRRHSSGSAVILHRPRHSPVIHQLLSNPFAPYANRRLPTRQMNS